MKQGGNANISIEESLLSKSNDNIPIKAIVEKWRLDIEADQEGEDLERDEEEGE